MLAFENNDIPGVFSGRAAVTSSSAAGSCRRRPGGWWSARSWWRSQRALEREGARGPRWC